MHLNFYFRFFFLKDLIRPQCLLSWFAMCIFNAYACSSLKVRIEDFVLLTGSLFILQPSVRKQHNAGYKHKVLTSLSLSQYIYLPVSLSLSLLMKLVCELFTKIQANVRTYYQQFEEQQTQSLIDQRIKEHLGQAAAFQQVGAAYNQHLMGQRPRLPVLPTPVMPQLPGSSPLLPGMRPPVLPRPISGVPGTLLAPHLLLMHRSIHLGI